MKDNWPFCGRTVFLSGGPIATIEPLSDEVIIWPKTQDGKITQIKIDQYGKLFYAVNKINLNIIGVEFTSNESEYIGESPREFRGYVNQKNIWSNWDAIQTWGGIALSSFHNKNGISYDLSNKIRFQLNTINNRLKNLAISYQHQLNALVLKESFKNGQRFQDGYTDLVYQEFHSFLFDAGILRDNLCEYVYNFSNGGISKKQGKEITTAGGLLRFLNSKKDHSEIESYLKKEMSIDGWLFELGNYRDLVMHSAPINIASHKLYAIHEPIAMPEGKELPAVRFPLPANPEKLYSERCKKNDFNKYIENFKEISRISLQDRGKYDCLEYAHKVFSLLTNLSLEVANQSPFKPMRHRFIRTEQGLVSIPEYEERT
ncbi:TPA: hypothetical protein PJH99_002838 [Raoultella ornithinolytica]|uniref:hypothetical protein n=1 Tax=Raoultella ornithinolytica TaxID=54291 RepID=UPI002DB8AF9D|nr:hypothetical protein [Raoultella ornithinolytica]MEB8019533.1 hypothetical protein [Raoultella ornithinolytica]MEB8239713.1 hypothetical protein [Raoultella ornithinolytica]HDG9787257.1 hypothetical protein [Raoultella ornithinolytica]HDG9796932.1 hypothetical protein [Raoultella ornithinolytica]HDG9802771.1 hypothetical protein [Raoultella ornithinolytica]